MDFIKLVKHRESVRKYKNDSIPKAEILKCVDAARLAPSASNSQPWTYIVIDDIELAHEVAGNTYNKIIKFNKFTINAPVMIAVVMESGNFSSKLGSNKTGLDYNFIDLGISVEHFCLQAADLGIGTCILGYYDEKKIKKLLNTDDNKRIGLLISVGYPSDEIPREKKRKSLDEMCKFNSYK